jgi:LPXTG-motif cell wall-anchored protein
LLFRNAGNGSVKRAEIYSSLDGVNYQKVFSNASDSGNAAWTTDGQVKIIGFDAPIKARYFKIVTKESVGNFLTMREFRPYMVDGSKGQLVGDWNNGGTIEEGDLTFLQNYTGLSSVDADWDYVSMADLNFNNVIDAYDISYVASQLEGGIVPTEGGNVAGEIMLVPNKTSISAGETFTVDVVGTGLTDVNAFSAEVPLDSSKYEFIKTEGAVSTASMKNFSKIRVHSDNSQDLYTVFTNIGDNVRLNGTDTLATITLKAKSDINFDLALSDALVVDSNLNSKNAVANITNPEDPLPGNKDSVVKVGKESITVTGDESQLQTGMGLSRLIDGTTSSDDSSRMDLKWVYSADQVDKGKLPFEMTFTFNEAKKFDNFTIYNRTNADGKNNIAAMKKVKAVGYLNGVATDLGEVSNITTAKTIYNLEGKSFDKIVIIALESNKDMYTLAINEIEFYEEKQQAPSSIEFLENVPTNLYVNKIAPIFAKVLPETANLNYKLTSENEEIVKVIRVDNDNSATYYLRGVKPGTAKVKATTADGKLSVEHEVTVLDGFDKSILIEAIKKGKSYSKNSEIYTEETYSELLKAIENAEKVLETAKTESELSSAIISIRVAINGLKERDDSNLNVIDFSKLEAIFATSEADSDFMENAVDGDENTIWHSGYQSSHKLPVSIVVKLDKPYNLNQIDYLPRQNSKNGHVTEYIVETSLDNENWTEARKGTFKEASNGSGLENRGYNPIRFNTTKAQYVRFTALKTLGDTRDKYASIAELKFYGQSEVDKSNLSSKISEAEALVEADYTAESFNAVKVAIDAAKGILNDNSATQEQVNEAINILSDAIDNLVKKEDVEEVNKTILAMAIEYVQNLKANGELEGVVPAVIKELEAALKEAKEVLGNENATQAQVDIAEKRLINVIHMLEFKVGDKTKFKELVEIIKVLDESKYTTSTWNALQVELEKADKVIADENAMEEEVAKTYESLNKAFAELELVADNSRLRELVAELEAKDLSKYTTGTVNKFKAELDYAKGILSNKDASQEEINEAYNKLIKAYLDLRLIRDKSLLEDLIRKAEAIDLSKYTKESANKVSLELANVRSVFNNEEASQSEVDEAANGLKLALEGLIASNGNGGNTNNEGNGNNNGNGNGNNNGNNNGNGNGNNNGNGHGNNNNNNSNNGGKLPSTGGTPASAMALLGTLTTAVGISIMRKRNK